MCIRDRSTARDEARPEGDRCSRRWWTDGFAAATACSRSVPRRTTRAAPGRFTYCFAGRTAHTAPGAGVTPHDTPCAASAATWPGKVTDFLASGRRSMRGDWPYSLTPLAPAKALVSTTCSAPQSLAIACRPGNPSLDCPLAGTKRHRRFVSFRLALQRRSVRAASHCDAQPSRRPRDENR